MADDILNTPPAGEQQPGEQTPPAGQQPPAGDPPAAPAAPAQPATPPAPAAPASSTDDKGKVTYEPTGDAGLDLALEFFGGLGLSFDSPEIQEAGKGNFSYLEAKLAAMGDEGKGGDRYLAIAKDAYSRLQTNSKAEYEARKQVVVDAVGGEETWTSIQEFVKANAEPQELDEVRAALTQGGIVAKAMAELLHRQYLAASGTTVEPASPVRNQASAPAGGAPLTRAGYLEELNGLVAKIGSHRLEGSPEYAALRKKYSNVK